MCAKIVDEETVVDRNYRRYENLIFGNFLPKIDVLNMQENIWYLIGTNKFLCVHTEIMLSQGVHEN